ncbi:hypothetical protein CEXT_776671 [Caerostris extrusa]|uniref:Uncharacterized protein n=1 Tax=Caerostris extrusa TaxID=172846 RepID=A0AAV4WID9_CAEEX|nr:hypothetical protein CEXT_776671 [Caerostris extrusa]
MGHVTKRGCCCWMSRKGRRDASFNFALQSFSPSTLDPGVSVVTRGRMESRSVLYTPRVLGFVDSGEIFEGPADPFVVMATGMGNSRRPYFVWRLRLSDCRNLFPVFFLGVVAAKGYIRI